MNRVKLFAHGMECRECAVVRDFLAENNISFEEVEIDRTPGTLSELVELTGSATHVPVVKINGEVFVDFDDDIAARILELTKGIAKA